MLRRNHTKKSEGNFSGESFENKNENENKTNILIAIGVIVIILILLLFGCVILIGIFSIWTFSSIGQIPVECPAECPVLGESEADALKKSCQAYCNDTCSNTTDCPTLAFRDLRFLLPFNNHSYSIIIEKDCVMGRCFYYYEAHFPGTSETYDAFGFSILPIQYFNVDNTVTETDTFTLLNASEIISSPMGLFYGSWDETTANWEIDQFCMGVLHPNQTNVLFDCIIPHLLRINDEILIACYFTFDCTVNASTYLTTKVFNSPAIAV